MGFTKRTGGGGKFASVMQGKIVIPCEEDDEGAVGRVNKNGKQVWEHLHDGFEGHLIRAKFQKANDVKFSDKINVTLKDKEEGVAITIGLEVGGNASTFFQVMKNIDLRVPVAIEPYDYTSKKDGKRKVGIGITQRGESLAFTWNKDDDELPAWTKHTVDGKTIWGKEKQNKFFLKHFDAWVEEKFSADDESDDSDDSPPPTKKKTNQSSPPPDDEDMDGDDLDF